MRRSLAWALLAALVASGYVLLPGSPTTVPSREPTRPESPADAAAARNNDQAVTSTVNPQLPSDLPRTSVNLGKRDPFVPVVASAPPPPPVKVIPVAIQRSEPPLPQAPTLDLQYLGSMRAPDGARLVFLKRGEQEVQIAAGQQLEEGYVVESVDENEVKLIYPPLHLKVSLPIPQAASQ